MTANRQHSEKHGPEREDVRARLERLDGQFAAGLDDDERLCSGISAAQRAAELDFVLMTGVTRSKPAPVSDMKTSAFTGAVDAADPISFFEPGVADVDAAMAPPSLDEADALETEVIAARLMRPPALTPIEVPSAEESTPESDVNELCADVDAGEPEVAATVEQPEDEAPVAEVVTEAASCELEPSAILDMKKILEEFSIALCTAPETNPEPVGEAPEAPCESEEEPARPDSYEDEPFLGYASEFTREAVTESQSELPSAENVADAAVSAEDNDELETARDAIDTALANLAAKIEKAATIEWPHGSAPNMPVTYFAPTDVESAEIEEPAAEDMGAQEPEPETVLRSPGDIEIPVEVPEPPADVFAGDEEPSDFTPEQVFVAPEIEESEVVDAVPVDIEIPVEIEGPVGEVADEVDDETLEIEVPPFEEPEVVDVVPDGIGIQVSLEEPAADFVPFEFEDPDVVDATPVETGAPDAFEEPAADFSVAPEFEDLKAEEPEYIDAARADIEFPGDVDEDSDGAAGISGEDDSSDFTPEGFEGAPGAVEVDIAALTANCLAEPQESASCVPSPLSLVEAEQLLQALESQPRDIAVEKSPAPVAGPVTAPVLETGGEADESVYRQPASRRMHRRSRRSPRQMRKKLIRWCIRASFIVIFCVGGYAAYDEFKPRMVSAQTVLREAERLMSARDYAAASRSYAQFAENFAGAPERADAQFMSAYCLMIAPAADFDAESANLTAALDRITKFMGDNPGHAKFVRARTMAGQLHFRLRHYEAAIDLLRDPDLRLKDPEAAIPALRALARAYTQLGEYDSAESAYLQSASMTGNYTPDVDYDELGDLFKLRSERADTDEMQADFQNKAIKFWTDAVRVPGIDPTNKSKIQGKIDWLASHAASPASAEGAPAAVPAASEPEPDPAAAAISEAPAAPAVAPQEPNPAAELQFLAPAKGNAS